MTVAFKPPEAESPEPSCREALRQAMRRMAGGVSVITVGTGAERTGLTATTATSLSIEPPTMLICVNRAASAWPVLRTHGHFAVNILGSDQAEVANRFAGRDGVNGAARYEGAEWARLGSGVLGLRDALAVVECAVADTIERGSHAIVIGTVLGVTLSPAAGRDPLVYAHGRFAALRHV